MSSLMDQTIEINKLSYEIFSILESKFLFSNPSGKVRILCIDAASDDGLLAAISLSRLEALLKKHSADPFASIADFFDVAAGAGPGALLAAMLFTRSPDGRPLFSAEESLRFLSSRKTNQQNKNRVLRKILCSHKGGNKFKSIFSELTLRDTLKPVLISCFDLITGSPFMFSRSDAVESEGYDFSIADVCAAATSSPNHVTEVRSVDRSTKIKAIGGGGVGMRNPTAAALTHVLNNKRDFPFTDGTEDLLVVSLGSSTANFGGKVGEIAGEGAADAVDQSVAMAFGENVSTNYIRIQANGSGSNNKKSERWSISTADTMLKQRYIESVMFRRRKVSNFTNGEKIEWVVSELIKEQDRRRTSAVPTVMIKLSGATPRSSSATTETSITATSASILVMKCIYVFIFIQGFFAYIFVCHHEIYLVLVDQLLDIR